MEAPGRSLASRAESSTGSIAMMVGGGTSSAGAGAGALSVIGRGDGRAVSLGGLVERIARGSRRVEPRAGVETEREGGEGSVKGGIRVWRSCMEVQVCRRARMSEPFWSGRGEEARGVAYEEVEEDVVEWVDMVVGG